MHKDYPSLKVFIELSADSIKARAKSSLNKKGYIFEEKNIFV